MSRTFFQDFKLDDGRDVTAEYKYENDSACVIDTWVNIDPDDENPPKVELTNAERKRFEARIMEVRYHDDHRY